MLGACLGSTAAAKQLAVARLHPGRSRALARILHRFEIEVHCLPFGQLLEQISGDRAAVKEHVFAATAGRDEADPLVGDDFGDGAD